MKIEIKNRFTAEVIFECESDSLQIAVELAVKNKINLREANLYGAYLSGANLSGANLSGANLSYADLSYANLSDANLSCANLNYANLNIAYLNDANLSGANLSGVNLSYANLSRADLRDVKDDSLAKLKLAKAEAVGLFKCLIDGKINGSSYRGDCACFVGTIANVKKCDPSELSSTIGLNMDPGSPIERWFSGIRKGDTPENNPISAITVEWLREWAKENNISLPERKIVWSDQ